VFIGRPAAWGLAVGGSDGVARVLDTIRGELADDAGLCGIDDITRIAPDVVSSGSG
jgi:4-hydroxymandelate oxidase